MTLLSNKLGSWDLTPGISLYVLLTLLVGIVAACVCRRQRKVWLIERIPGPRGLPFLGNLLYIWVDHEELFRRIYKISEYGDVARFWLGTKPYCILSSAETVETILSSQKYLDKGSDYALLHPWIGEGLITSSGSKWHSRRKMLTPAFHFKILEDFLEVFTAQADILITKLKAKADGNFFDIFHYIALCALDIICETAMGRTVGAQENSESEFVKSVPELTSLLQYRQLRPWLFPDFIFRRTSHGKRHDACIKVIHDLAKETIEIRKNARKRSGGKAHANEDVMGQKNHQAFLDLLLEYAESNPEFTHKDILEEVNTFMFAGHDTTTTAINFFLYLMGVQPEMQNRIHKELDLVFQGSDRQATMADLRGLKFLDLCLKESMRIYTVVPMVYRELKQEVVIKNYRIPAGTTMVIHSYRLHRDPKQFPDPERFDPDRFLPENCAKRHPYAYVPFSAGPRNCIGQKFAQLEMKVILSSILRAFRVESKVPLQELRVLGEMILRPKGGNIVRLIPRNRNP